MSEELEAFRKTNTWDLVLLLPGVRPVSCKWMYKVKTKADRSVDRYKARLVARGFTQEHGIDYEETFAPVAKMTSIRTIIASAAALKWPLYQMDVKNAFLNGDLSEVVYMQPPPGISAPDGHVCRLCRALYGLKQAPRAWFERFRQSLLSIGYTQSTADYSMFRRTTQSGIVILILYVDDMVITGNDSAAISCNAPGPVKGRVTSLS